MNLEGKFLVSRKFLILVGILAALFITAASIWIYQANQPKRVQFVHNGESKAVATKAKNVGQFLKEQNVHLDSYDQLSPAQDQKIKDGLKITYTDQWLVKLQVGNESRKVITGKRTVKEVLQQERIALGEWDRVVPSVEAYVSPSQTITVTRVEKKIIEREQMIPYNEVTRKDYLLAQGQKKVIQQGQEGKAIQRYEIIYENGVEKSRRLLATKVIQAKQDRVVAIGTLTTVSRGGASFVPRKVLSNVVLTAYSAGVSNTGKGPGHPQYAITASGRRAQEGRTIAVDPNVIPLGTWVWIEGVGFRRAEDTGGAVKGNKIDIYYENNQTALRFGKRRTDKVYVIGRTKPQ